MSFPGFPPSYSAGWELRPYHWEIVKAEFEALSKDKQQPWRAYINEHLLPRYRFDPFGKQLRRAGKLLVPAGGSVTELLAQRRAAHFLRGGMLGMRLCEAVLGSGQFGHRLALVGEAPGHALGLAVPDTSSKVRAQLLTYANEGQRRVIEVYTDIKARVTPDITGNPQSQEHFCYGLDVAMFCLGKVMDTPAAYPEPAQ